MQLVLKSEFTFFDRPSTEKTDKKRKVIQVFEDRTFLGANLCQQMKWNIVIFEESHTVDGTLWETGLVCTHLRFRAHLNNHLVTYVQTSDTY